MYTIRHFFFADEHHRHLQNVFESSTLNNFMQLGPTAWRSVRQRLFELLRCGVETFRKNYELWDAAFTPIEEVRMHVPVDVSSLVHFDACETHVKNVRALIDEERARQQGSQRDGSKKRELPLSWYAVPLARDGCSSAVTVSGTPIRRPHGLVFSGGADRREQFGATRRLDCQVELGMLVGGQARSLRSTSTPIAIDDTPNHIFGCVLVTSWIARDFIEQLLDPYSSHFDSISDAGHCRPIASRIVATTCSPWVVPLDALMPFMTDGEVQQRSNLLPHLRHSESFFLDAQLELAMRPGGSTASNKAIISKVNARNVYWSMKQQLAHRCQCAWPLRPGDLLTSGAISDGSQRNRVGSLLEASSNGREPLVLQSGQHTFRRCFVEDGDEVIVSGYCQGEGYRVGFGESRTVVLPAIATLI